MGRGPVLGVVLVDKSACCGDDGPMRTTDQESNYGTDSHSVGEGVPNSTSTSTTEVDLVDYEDDGVYDPPDPGSDDPFGPGSDTTHLDEALADLDDEEAEDLVLEVFEDVYGSDTMAEQAYDDIQQTAGLDAHEILDIIFGSGASGTDGYGDSGTDPGSSDDWYDDDVDPLGSDSTYDTDSSVLPGDEGDGSLADAGQSASDLFGGDGLGGDDLGDGDLGGDLDAPPTLQSAADLDGPDDLGPEVF